LDILVQSNRDHFQIHQEEKVSRAGVIAGDDMCFSCLQQAGVSSRLHLIEQMPGSIFCPLHQKGKIMGRLKYMSFRTLLLLAASAAICNSASNKSTVAVSDGKFAVSDDGREKIEIPYAAQRPLTDSGAGYAGFKTEQTILHKGYVAEKGRRPFSTETVLDRDTAIKLRDGTIIYADIYRPVTKEKVPAIISYGPAGKHATQQNMLDGMGGKDGVPVRLGIPRNGTSGLQGWESPDPAAWVPDGYAVVNVDVRGAYMSQGNLQLFGTQNAEDGYDVIEFIASQSWCNGKVGLNGNSWYAIVQWSIAATHPPHLVAIAPWEGEFDVYRDEYVRDGIPMQTMGEGAAQRAYGPGLIEDYQAMIKKYPLMNAYWESKIPLLENITVPAYVVGGYNSQIHTRGTYEAFNRISSKEKWLRIHNINEWVDLYTESNRQDLRKFFDYYLKGIKNDWLSTPRVRLTLFDPGHQDIVNRAEKEYPPARQQLTKLYLDAATGKLSTNAVAKASRISYKADSNGRADFVITFDRDTEIAGYSKLHLWVQAEDADDMDVYTRITKLDAAGKPLFQNSITFKYSGPDGMLRVSHRQLDEAKSTASMPVHTHRTLQLLKPGEIVPIEIQLWPTGMVFHKGEQLRLTVDSFDFAESKPMDRPQRVAYNKGTHIIHTGGKYDSYLLVPVIPEAK
jgi:uncharacterized protein